MPANTNFLMTKKPFRVIKVFDTGNYPICLLASFFSLGCLSFSSQIQILNPDV